MNQWIRKTIWPGVIAAGLLGAMGSAQAEYIVDTGAGIQLGPVFASRQYFAGEFSVSAPKTINLIEGYYSNNCNYSGRPK